MSIFTSHKRGQVLSIISFGVAIIGVLAAFGLIGLEAYVRWSLNQNFSFLGGDTLPALLIASFALLFGVTYLHKSHIE